MNAFSWIVGALLAAIFIACAAINVYAIVSYLRYRRHISAIPFVGGLAGILACFLLPMNGLHSLWWLPPIVDYGTLPMAVSFFIARLSATREH